MRRPRPRRSGSQIHVCGGQFGGGARAGRGRRLGGGRGIILGPIIGTAVYALDNGLPYGLIALMLVITVRR